MSMNYLTKCNLATITQEQPFNPAFVNLCIILIFSAEGHTNTTKNCNTFVCQTEEGQALDDFHGSFMIQL